MKSATSDFCGLFFCLNNTSDYSFSATRHKSSVFILNLIGTASNLHVTTKFPPKRKVQIVNFLIEHRFGLQVKTTEEHFLFPSVIAV